MSFYNSADICIMIGNIYIIKLESHTDIDETHDTLSFTTMEIFTTHQINIVFLKILSKHFYSLLSKLKLIYVIIDLLLPYSICVFEV
jgi:hypothetical protein